MTGERRDGVSATSHEIWDELAAGHALHALEPDDERLFTEHLAGCELCSAALGDYTLVAAQLGSLADGEDAEVPSWQQMRAGILTPATVTSLHARRQTRAARLLAAAAVVVMLAGGGVAVWQATGHSTDTHSPSVAALAACERQAGCHAVRLHTANGASLAAIVVDSDHVAVLPLTLSDVPSGRTYVLWQLPRDGAPIPVAEFRDTTHQTASTPLPAEYADTAAFAISIESAAAPPSRPTHVLAVGSAA